MDRTEVLFNEQAFWDSIKEQKCKRKLKGALEHLKKAIKRGPSTERMFICKKYLDGKLAGSKSIYDI